MLLKNKCLLWGPPPPPLNTWLSRESLNLFFCELQLVNNVEQGIITLSNLLLKIWILSPLMWNCPNMPAGSYPVHMRHHLQKYENKMLKVARNALNIGDIWNPVCCLPSGNKTFKLKLCSTFNRILLQRIKHFCYKLAEIFFRHNNLSKFG